MAQTLTITDASTNPRRQESETRTATSETPRRPLLARLARQFWSHTEDMGETDTRSYEGLL